MKYLKKAQTQKKKKTALTCVNDSGRVQQLIVHLLPDQIVLVFGLKKNPFRHLQQIKKDKWK
jgi:hypothetical protein